MRPLSRSFATQMLTLLLAVFQISASLAQTKPSVPAQPSPGLTSGKPGDVSLPPIRTINLRSPVIGIPAFDLEGGAGGVSPAFFPQVIYGDLTMLSDFKKANDSFVEETHRHDQRLQSKDTVDYAEWGRVQCDFVLKGTFSVDSRGRISAECRLFDVTYRTRTFGLKFKEYPVANARDLAHKISDAVVLHVFGKKAVGISSTKIAYVGRTPEGKKEVFVMDADGSNVRQVTFDKSLVATPCWGANATEIYYTSWRDVNPDLWGVQLGAGTTWPVSRRPGLNYTANWNQKIGRIALTLGRDGNSEIYTMERSGSERTLVRLTRTPAIDSSPSWSPDGAQIVFQSDRTGGPQIWMMNADGSNPRRLTSRGTYNDAPMWSPKGDRIAWVARDQGRLDIYTMDLNGGSIMQLTNGPGKNEDPCWAPDGEHIAFASNRTGNYEIYVMRRDGSSVQRLTTSREATSPAWSPGLGQ
jgi:TolB protein